MIISKQYLESGTYTLSLEESITTDLTSYVFTRFGTFRIVPVTGNIQTFSSLERYLVFLDDGLIGESAVTGTGAFDNYVAYAMASAINIVTTKINEFVDKEERAVLSQLVSDFVDTMDISEEQKAMYRTFLIDNDRLNDVLAEIDSPTDILGNYNG